MLDELLHMLNKLPAKNQQIPAFGGADVRLAFQMCYTVAVHFFIF